LYKFAYLKFKKERFGMLERFGWLKKARKLGWSAWREWCAWRGLVAQSEQRGWGRWKRKGYVFDDLQRRAERKIFEWPRPTLVKDV
jgi:hypothetical protein